MTNGEKYKTAIERIEAFNKVYNPEIEQKVREIAEMKMPDLNANDLEAATNIICGTAKNMGIVVKD